MIRVNLSDMAGGYWVQLHCNSCRHSVSLDPLDLLEAHGDLSLWSVVCRAICSKCGARMPHFLMGACSRPDGTDRPRQRPGIKRQ